MTLRGVGVKMKKILLFLFIGIFLISSISALDRELPQACGGDDQLIIPCFGDDELTWLAGLPPEEAPAGGPGAGPGPALEELVLVEEEIVEPKVTFLYSIISFFGIELEDLMLLVVMILIMFILLFIIFYKRRKEKKKKLLLLAKEEEEEKKKKKKTFIKITHF